jgi:endonuclease-3
MDPISELVSTILSQNTNDVNRDRAFQQLRGRFSSWEAVRDADVDEIKDAIRVSGLANSKAPTIQRARRLPSCCCSLLADRPSRSIRMCTA